MGSRFCRISAIVVLAALLGSAAAQTAKPAAQAGTGITRQQADEILDELRQIRRLLERQPNGDAIASELRLMRQTMERQQAAAPTPAAAPQPAQNARINVAGLKVMGRKDAPLTMVEFSDYQCPFCRAFHSTTFEQIKKEWIDSGKLRFISWDLPLEFHSNAAKAAQAAHCAGEQNKFWELRRLLIANATRLESDAIIGYAQQVPQLDVAAFKACVASDKYSAEIKKSADAANAQGISGTPTFLIAKSSGDTVDGVLFIGAQPYAAFNAAFNDQLAK
jgi:protein-disulfide isomerase